MELLIIGVMCLLDLFWQGWGNFSWEVQMQKIVVTIQINSG